MTFTLIRMIYYGMERTYARKKEFHPNQGGRSWSSDFISNHSIIIITVFSDQIQADKILLTIFIQAARVKMNQRELTRLMDMVMRLQVV